jgi:hypothetical protein
VEKLPKSNGESKRNFDSAHVTFPFVLGANYIGKLSSSPTPQSWYLHLPPKKERRDLRPQPSNTCSLKRVKQQPRERSRTRIGVDGSAALPPWRVRSPRCNTELNLSSEIALRRSFNIPGRAVI